MSAPGQVPPPRLASRPSRFYLPTHDSHASSHATQSGFTSRRSSFVPSAPASAPQSPSFPRRHGSHGSRASLSALRTALQEYQVPSVPSTSSGASVDLPPLPLPVGTPHTPPNQIAVDPIGHDLPIGERSLSGLRSAWGEGLTSEQMDALVEIHRVLYRGREDLEAEGRTLRWREQGEEVQRVVERWFEGDCVYDHPLVRISSRQSLLTHFILLHLLSTFYLPAVGPSALLLHAQTLTRILRDRLLGVDNDAESTAGPETQPQINKGKGKAIAPLGVEEEWLGLVPHTVAAPFRKPPAREEAKGWWKLWDVSADCREIGGMECYDGYHLALIDHVITLTLFPSISRPRTGGLLSVSSASISTLELTSAATPASFLSKVASSLAEELDGLLHWDLPISTIVQFNEVGRATHVRDIVDVRDLFESVVPFARRFNWLTRRLSGFFTSSLGSLALSFLPQSVAQASTAMLEEKLKTKPFLASLDQGAPSVGLGLGFGDVKMTKPQIIRSTTSDRENLLGLEGMRGMAPDVDAEALDTT